MKFEGLKANCIVPFSCASTSVASTTEVDTNCRDGKRRASLYSTNNALITVELCPIADGRMVKLAELMGEEKLKPSNFDSRLALTELTWIVKVLPTSIICAMLKIRRPKHNAYKF